MPNVFFIACILPYDLKEATLRVRFLMFIQLVHEICGKSLQIAPDLFVQPLGSHPKAGPFPGAHGCFHTNEDNLYDK